MHVGKLITSCTHLHSKGNSMPSYIHLGSDLNIHLGRYSFTLCKGISCHMFTYIHTIERCFPCYLYLHTYLHTIEKYFPRYLVAKYPSWGSPNSSKNFHKQVLIFTLFYFQNQNLGSWS